MRCRAKNPGLCRDPRCPEKRYILTSSQGLTSPSQNERRAHREILAEELKVSEEQLSKLNSTVKEALIRYTDQDYDDLNKALRAGTPLSTSQKQFVESLDTAIAEGSRTPQKKSLLRSIKAPLGENPSDWVRKTFPIGETVHFAGYGSTTPSVCSVVAMLGAEPQHKSMFVSQDMFEEMKKEVTANNIVLEMHTESGISVSSISHMPQEAEVLLPRGQNYFVSEIDTVVYESDEDILARPGYTHEPNKYPAIRVRLIDVGLINHDRE